MLGSNTAQLASQLVTPGGGEVPLQAPDWHSELYCLGGAESRNSAVGKWASACAQSQGIKDNLEVWRGGSLPSFLGNRKLATFAVQVANLLCGLEDKMCLSAK